MVGWSEFSCWSKLGRAKLALTMIILSFEGLAMIILSLPCNDHPVEIFCYAVSIEPLTFFSLTNIDYLPKNYKREVNFKENSELLESVKRKGIEHN